MRQGCEERPSPKSQAHLLQLRAGPHLAAPETAPPPSRSRTSPGRRGGGRTAWRAASLKASLVRLSRPMATHKACLPSRDPEQGVTTLAIPRAWNKPSVIGERPLRLWVSWEVPVGQLHMTQREFQKQWDQFKSWLCDGLAGQAQAGAQPLGLNPVPATCGSRPRWSLGGF